MPGLIDQMPLNECETSIISHSHVCLSKAALQQGGSVGVTAAGGKGDGLPEVYS